MEGYIINIDPIFKYLVTIAGIILLGVIAFLFHNFKGLNLFSKHDNSVIDKFLSKYPDVSPEFMKKDAKAQNVENNQEIHEINKKLAELEEKINKLLNSP